MIALHPESVDDIIEGQGRNFVYRKDYRMRHTYTKYIIALLLFGSNGIVASFINMSSHEIVFFRTMLGSLLLLAIFFLGKRKFTFHKHKKQFLFLAISGMAMGTSWMLLYEAYARIGVSVASLLYYCGTVIVMVL